MDRWTVNVGLRYDVQENENLASTSLANPEVPNLLPELTFGARCRRFDGRPSCRHRRDLRSG